MDTATLRSRLIDVDGDAIEFCYAQGWTDGLPVVPPTATRVREFLAAGGRPPEDVVFEYVDRSRVVTVEKVAINAVMAGCRPEYFPVVLTIVEAMGDPGFFLHAANASTSGVSLGFVVNGPIRDQLGMNYRGNVFGPGNRANSTIGRAVRLTQINAMGSVPGAGNEAGELPTRPILDRSTIGQPAKYAGYHVPEFEEAFPTLEPLHVLNGFSREQSVVSIFDVVGHLQIPARGERSAVDTLATMCTYLVGSGRLRPFGDCVIVMAPEICQMFVRDGFTKRDIADALYAGTTRTIAWVKRSGGMVNVGPMDTFGQPVTEQDEATEVAIAGGPDHIHVVVAGGPAGAFIYALLPMIGGWVMREIRRPAEPVESH